MQRALFRRTLAPACAVIAFLAAGAVHAQPMEVGAPLWSTGTGDKPVQSDGAALQNLGLVGVARLPADTVDFLGDTLGSISGMAIAPGSWKKDGNTYTARLYSLPDRGRNSPEDNEYSDYAGRLVEYDLTFVPGKSLSLKPTGKGIEFKDFNGKPTTGADPGAGLVTEDGYELPSPAEGALGAGKVSLDAEAVAFQPDGSFYVGDEYAAGIYYFGPDGKMKGFIAPDPAVAPMKDGKLNDNSVKAPDTGRRNNQGIEAVSITPDGKTLVAVLQSATLQDSSASKDQANRANTRIFLYDIAGNPTPKAPKAVYALTLPVIASKGDGKIDKTAAQSEVVALDDHRFLVLSRDGNGLGAKAGVPEVFKVILLVDTNGATNLAGTDYETGTKPIAPAEGGKNVLDPAIKPVSTAILLNLLNPDDLGKFGLNIHNDKQDENTLSEKWEAMALVPALDPAKPDDYFLFVGNDNDFLTKKGVMQGKAYSDDVDNPTTVLAYRLSLPGIKLGR